MGFSETLELLLTANASGGINEVRKFATESGKSVTEVESNFKRLGASMMKIGGTGMAAGGFLTALGDKERQASEGLKASIQAAGQSYDEFEGKVEGAVKSQENFGHSAVETDQALSTLVGSFGDTSQALDRMQLVADLAAKKHIGLADAASIVAKAHGGAGRIFKEFNIQVQENADGTKNYDGALDELSKKVSGQASASVSGLSGQFQILATKAEDFVAGLGENFGPAILGISTGLTALGGVMSAVGAGLTALKAHHLEAAAAAETQTLAESALAVGIGGIVVAAIVGGAVALDKLTSSGKMAKISIEQLASMSGEDLSKLADKMKQAGDAAQGFNLRAMFTTEGLKSLEDESLSNVAAATRFADQLEASGVNVDDYRAKIAAKSEADIQAAKDQNTNSQAIQDGTGALKENTATLYTNIAAVKDQIDQQHAAIDPFFAVMKATKDNAAAQKDYNDAVKKSGAGSQEASDALMKVASTALDVNDATQQLSASMRDGKTSTKGASDQLNVWVAQGLLTQKQADTIAFSLGIVTGQMDSLNGKRSEMTVAADTADAEYRIAALYAHVQSLQSLANQGVIVKVGPGVPAVHSAGGQTNFRGGMSWVGENGPELLELPRGSNVYTHAQSMAMAGGGGSSSPVPMGQGLTVYLDARGSMMSGEQVVAALHNHARSNTAPVLLKEWLAS